MSVYKRLVLCAVALGVSFAHGCASEDTGGGGAASMDEMAAAANARATQDEQPKAAEQGAASDPAEDPASESAPAEQPQVAGRAGVGEGGYYTSIVGARRHVLNRVEDLAWVQAVQHFQAEHGRLPKDHAEFMSKIVEAHGIDLGYKEEDQEFLYDPSAGRWGEVYVVEKLEELAN